MRHASHSDCNSDAKYINEICQLKCNRKKRRYGNGYAHTKTDLSSIIQNNEGVT